MENKYYTPTIEEFYIGFEYESNYLEKEGVWIKKVLTQEESGFFFENYIADASPLEFRVKYLDQEDIQNEGWKKVDSTFGQYSLNDKYFLTLTNNLVHIGYDKGFQTWINVCLGVPIYNKSEFNKLVKKLGIGN